MKKFKVLHKPYTEQEIRQQMDEHGYVSGLVSMTFSAIISYDCEQVLDILSEKLVGSQLLSDISYNAVGVDDVRSGDSDIIIEVRGIVEMPELED